MNREQVIEMARACGAEIEQLKEDGDMPVKYYQPNGKGRVYAVYGASSIDFADSLLEQLAASQAREMQLREALQQEYDYQFINYEGETAPWVAKALALPQDTTALEAMIAKAGEVMRERCAVEAWNAYSDKCMKSGMNPHSFDYWLCSNEIRALPDVTLEDLKGGVA